MPCLYGTCIACMVHVVTFADVRQIDSKKKFVQAFAMLQKLCVSLGQRP